MAGMRGKILDFNQRLEISIDVAHALTYLHLYSGEPTSYLVSYLFSFQNHFSVMVWDLIVKHSNIQL